MIKGLIFGSTIGAGLLILVGAFSLTRNAVPSDYSVCVKSHKELVTSFPYLGFTAIPGLQMLALMPVQTDEDICDQWQVVHD